MEPGNPWVRARAAILLLVAVLSETLSAAAEPVEDFYKGKTISLVIGSGEGGGYDISGRLIAEFLPRFIPGRPIVIPRNMPGASGARAAEYIYNAAPPDGTVICIPQPTMLLDKVLDPAVRHEPQAFTWIGRLGAVRTF